MTLHRVTTAEMLDLMGGHPPPPAAAGFQVRAAYFQVFEDRVAERYGRHYLETDFSLLAGCSPPEWWDFQSERHQHQIEERRRLVTRTTAN